MEVIQEATRISKQRNDLSYLLDITDKDITASFIFDLFGEFDGKAKCSPFDTITIPPNKYGKEGKKNKNSFVTTIGIWIFNKFFIEPDLFDVLGYLNETVNNKLMGKINKELSYALIEDRIDIEVMSRYLMKTQFFMQFVTILAPNYTEKMLTCSKMIDKKKKELIAKNKEAIENGDAVVAAQIEQELLDYASEYLGDDPGLDAFKSGAGGSYDNNFKNMFIMKGAIKNPDPNAVKEFDIATSNYIDGIKPEEYASFANALTAGPYNRAVKTQIGGYWEKLFGRGFGHLKLGPKDSDCGTEGFITITLTKDNLDGFMYSYIKSGSQLIELTTENADKYMGKAIKLRSALFCKSKDCFCNKCAGNFFYRLNRQNMGAIAPSVPSILKNKSMKQFHDATVKITEMDVMKAFGVDK